jgi:hypothetical protein
MNQHRSNAAGFDRTPRSTADPGSSDESKVPRGLAAEDEEKEAFDHDRFPDAFYRGVIVFLDSVRGRGVIRSYSGRELRFEFPFVTVVGAPLGGRSPGIDLLRQGDGVGFDVGWTSKGLRVTTIKPTTHRE